MTLFDFLTLRSRAAAPRYLLLKILYIPVPQTAHLPLRALRPFFIVSSFASLISRLALHFTQYPSFIEMASMLRRHCARRLIGRGD
jgi:hypothetical protein